MYKCLAELKHCRTESDKLCIYTQCTYRAVQCRHKVEVCVFAMAMLLLLMIIIIIISIEYYYHALCILNCKTWLRQWLCLNLYGSVWAMLCIYIYTFIVPCCRSGALTIERETHSHNSQQNCLSFQHSKSQKHIEQRQLQQQHEYIYKYIIWLSLLLYGICV